jgi:uroporphyrinogen III methyltransferase / synthase
MQNKYPLSGIRVLVTRAAHQAAELSSRLRDLGAEVIEMPMIEIAPPLSWDELDQAIRKIECYDWIFFASKNSARSLTERAAQISLHEAVSQALCAGKPRIAAIGKATADYVEQRGAKVDFMPDKFVAEALVEKFPNYPNLGGLKILWPRTDLGRDYILEKLTEAGADVSVVEAYRTIMPNDVEAIAGRLGELLRLRKLDVITLTSGQTARNFAQVLEQAMNVLSSSSSSRQAGQAINDRSRYANLLQDVTLVSIGPETTKSMVDCALPVGLEAKAHALEGLERAILSRFQNTLVDHK